MSEILRGKTVLLGVTGGIAAYKAAALASRITQAGAAVDVVLTPVAGEFVTELTFAGLTHRAVYTNPFSAERGPGHIALAERADVVVVAPATANTIAKLAHGIADNLLTSVILATAKPVLLAPAMNSGMWGAVATRRNVETLRGDGRHFVGPGTGLLACGTTGAGRMAEPEEIIEAIKEIFERQRVAAARQERA